ncbi:MAG: hypothetical protein M1818_000630 [Claussenomyces sp. TS43310]|nr:MAG: hypothetical protein M1818_000630 [Claussenomyces sp. TS43310]
MSFSAHTTDLGGSQLSAFRRKRKIRLQCPDAPPQSRSRSSPASRQRSSHDYLYKKSAEANLLNFVDFLSEENVNVEREIPLTDAEFIGAGSTMEVYSVNWKGRRVAIKRMRRDQRPIPSTNLPLEKDTVYLHATREFYSDVKSIMQEILVMSREPLSSHRNIVRLLAVSWDMEEEDNASHVFPPLLVVELAHQITPTLRAYYDKLACRTSFSTATNFIADIADGLSALHMCGVIHGDLKPENVLLFEDTRGKGALIAKICDFGFANIRVLDDTIRGRSEHWEAPEHMQGCPGDIREAAEELETALSASDVYSFGLVAIFIALDGGDPLDFQGISTEGVKELKFSDEARTKIQGKVRAHYSSIDQQEVGKAVDPYQVYTSIIYGTLQSLPSKRIDSLREIRLHITGKDPFASQRKLDRFKVRPFEDAFKSFNSLRNIFTKSKSPFSNRILDSLPPRIKEELLTIVGKTPEFGESQLHDLRRTRLLEMASKREPEEDKEPDWEKSKISIDVIRRLLSSTRDWFDFLATVGSRFLTSPSVEIDFLELESHLRPEIFTLIDGNNISNARKVLRANAFKSQETLPESGWSPIHLAAYQGRVEFIHMLVTEFGANPNSRCSRNRCTPLHQAVIGESIKAVKTLLDLGGDVDARFNMAEGEQEYTALEIVMTHSSSGSTSKEDTDIIRLLLHRGADYLRNFKGYPIIFSAVKNINILKLVFDCIGPEDARLVVHFTDAERQTLLHIAVISVNVEVVKLLLDYGADPSAREFSGQTPYAKLMTAMALQGTFPWAPVQAIETFIFKKQFNIDDAHVVLSLLQEKGGNAVAIDDDTFSKEDVEGLLSRFKSYPRLGKIYNPLAIANANSQISQYFSSESPYLANIICYDAEHAVVALARSLATWADRRKKGLISPEDLPEDWLEFFQEANVEMKGLLTSGMQEDQIPEITKLLKETSVNICEWAVDNNGPEILVQLSRIIQEAHRTGTAEGLEKHGTAVAMVLFKISQQGFQFSLLTKTYLYQQLKQIWRAISKGEVLDLLHELAVMAHVDENIDNINEYTIADPLRSGPKPPTSALNNLSLPKRYQGTKIFVTTRNFLLPPTRIALFFVQLAIFLFPWALLFVSLTLELRSRKCDSNTTIILAYLWAQLLPSRWVFIDMHYRFHPNLVRGLQATCELILFRLWHLFPLEEPLILSFRTEKPLQVNIPSLLDSMRKDALFPIYWLSLAPEGVAMPVPCYRAMGELMTKWKDGRLPRKAWGDGWWELRSEEESSWKRINVNERPTWSQYTKASGEIKAYLMAKDCPSVYREFLSIRDYYLEPPGQQLIAMHKLFGSEHSACTAIWQSVFLDESDPSSKPYRKRNKLGWLERVVAELGLDKIKDLVTYTRDTELLDERWLTW